MTLVNELTGIVLAGGLSSRMGQDKASFPWGESDLLHTVLKVLAEVCGQIIVVTNTARQIDVPVITVADYFKGCGPLGGIHVGLTISKSTYNFIVGCDMPYLDSKAINSIALAAAGYDVVVPFIDGYFHPLHAVYNKSCLSKITKMLEKRQYRIIDLYPQVKTKYIEAGQLARFDSQLSMLCNINRISDL